MSIPFGKLVSIWIKVVRGQDQILFLVSNSLDIFKPFAGAEDAKPNAFTLSTLI